jgi:hypothetical protein
MRSITSAIMIAALFANIGILTSVAPAAAQTAYNVVCDGCVNSRDIANGTVTGRDIKDGSIGANDLAGSILPKAATMTGPVLAPTSQTQFTMMAATKVTLVVGQKVLVHSTAGLGSQAGSTVKLATCYQSTVAGSPIVNNPGIYDLDLPAFDRRMFSYTSLLSPPAPGEYLVGLCGMRGNNSLNFNDYFEVVAMVLRG